VQIFNSSSQKRISFFILFLVAALLLGRTYPLSAFRHQVRILLLNSYSGEDYWTSETNRGIFTAFSEKTANVEFFVENLDITGTFSAIHLPELRKLFQAKYTSIPPDLIISIGNDATTFALGQRGILLPEVPIVFCGLTNKALLSIFPPEKGTGVFNEEPSLLLLREILRLHHDAPVIAIITDLTPRGFRDIARMNEAAAKLGLPSGRLLPITGLDLDMITSAIAELPRGSVLILGHFSVTKEGNIASFSGLLEVLRSVSGLPIYSLLEEGAALGALGSVSAGGFQKGYQAAGIALRILEGEAPQAIAPVLSANSRILYNYSEMKEFNISKNGLAPESVVFGDPLDEFHRYTPLILGNTLLVLSLGGMVFFLRRKISRRIMTENDLIQQTEYWKKLFEYSPQGILIYDNTGEIKEANSRFRNMFRSSEHAAPAGNVLSLLSGAEISISQEEVFPLSEDSTAGEVSAMEVELPDGDGGKLSASFLAFPISVSDEGTYFCALFHDIRERKELANKLHRRAFLQERMTAISSRFVLFQDFTESMGAALEDILSLSGAKCASLFLLSEEGTLVPEMEIYSPDRKRNISIAENFSDKDDFFWRSALLKEKQSTILTLESNTLLRDGKWSFLRQSGIFSLSVLSLFVEENFQGVLLLVDPRSQWATPADEPMLRFFADLMALAIERRKEEASLRKAHDLIQNRFTGAVTALCQVSELRDVSTSGHQRNVSLLAERLTAEMNLSEETRLSVRYAALVHDLGKLYIPAEILGKPSPLSRAEYELVKKHPEFGHDILSPLNFPWPLAKIVLQHHERMDGQGYPFGLTGQQIIFEARLLSVVDAFDAMTSDRPYRKKKSTETALIELSDLAGTVYDAKIVEAFVTMIREKLGVTV